MNAAQKPNLFRHRNVFLVILILGVAHWIYVTWDNGWRVRRSSIVTEKTVEFEWTKETGFTKFDVKAYPGDWLGGRLLRGLLAAQLKPRVAAYLKPATWNRIEGDTVFTTVSFCPLVVSTELGTDASMVRDPTTTPLMRAAEFGDIESTRNLINSGVDVNAEDQNGGTALGYVSRCSGDAARDVTRLLLAAGASVNVAEKNGYTIL
jgi:hypothetical protein